MKKYINNSIIYLISLIFFVITSYAFVNYSYLAIIAILFFLFCIYLFAKVKNAPMIILISIIGGQLIRYNTGLGRGVILSDILLPIIIISWIFYKLAINKKNIQTNLNWPIILFVFWLIISWLINYTNFSSITSLFYLTRLISYILLYFVFVDLIDIKKNIYYINLIITIGVILSLLGFLQLIFFPDFSLFTEYYWDPHQNRLLSTFFDPNFLGGFLSIILAFVFSFYFFGNKKEKRLYFLLGIPIVIAIILTYSRSGYLSFFIVILLIGLFKSWKFLLISILCVILLICFVPRFQTRLIGAFEIDETSQLRIENWIETLEIIKEYPVSGLGYNNIVDYRIEKGIISEEGVAGHAVGGSDNSLLTIWLTTGIIGLLLFLLVYLIVIIDTYKVFKNKLFKNQYKAIALAVFISIFSIFANGQFINSLLYPHILLIIFFIFALFYKNMINKKNYD